MHVQMNIDESLQHLRQEMEKEARELHELQDKLRLATEDATKRQQEIPQLQRKIEEDRHEIYTDGTDADKYKKEIARLQREKLLHQNALNQLQRSTQQAARDHSRLTH